MRRNGDIMLKGIALIVALPALAVLAYFVGLVLLVGGAVAFVGIPVALAFDKLGIMEFFEESQLTPEQERQKRRVEAEDDRAFEKCFHRPRGSGCPKCHRPLPCATHGR